MINTEKVQLILNREAMNYASLLQDITGAVKYTDLKSHMYRMDAPADLTEKALFRAANFYNVKL